MIVYKKNKINNFIMKTKEMSLFFEQFNFDPQKTLFVGIEREAFTSKNGKILPIVPEVLPVINSFKPEFQVFGYELSACQIEMKYGPYSHSDVYSGLINAEYERKSFEEKLNFECHFSDTAGQDISLDIYPDPTGRYAAIAKSLSPEVLHAACFVAGTHVHIGMPSADDALRVYNNLCSHVDELTQMGDNSKGERLLYYRLMSKETTPKKHESLQSWFEDSVEKGYSCDPRKCWTLIRISVHGTIEFRMFGSTPDIDKINQWVSVCRNLCCQYL